MIVRLKAYYRDNSAKKAARFNSMIVRLKVWLGRAAWVNELLFQFYDSPIKRSSNTNANIFSQFVSIL